MGDDRIHRRLKYGKYRHLGQKKIKSHRVNRVSLRSWESFNFKLLETATQKKAKRSEK